MKAGIRSRGFSLIEMMLVVIIILIIGAFAVPNLLIAYRSYKMGAAARDVANIVSRARYEAVRANTNIATIYALTPGTNYQQFGIDLNGNGALDAAEPRILLPREITLVLPANKGPFIAQAATMGVAYQNQDVPGNPGNPFALTFTPRGTVCTLATSCAIPLLAPNNIGVFFLQNEYNDRSAVTVTRMGQVRLWRANAVTPAWVPY